MSKTIDIKTASDTELQSAAWEKRELVDMFVNELNAIRKELATRAQERSLKIVEPEVEKAE